LMIKASAYNDGLAKKAIKIDSSDQPTKYLIPIK